MFEGSVFRCDEGSFVVSWSFVVCFAGAMGEVFAEVGGTMYSQ
ncbi:hypothetical protein A2U01_0055385, partial [Trifolium medium]|nr:hypothetical protein [Trifolium medium]